MLYSGYGLLTSTRSVIIEDSDSLIWVDRCIKEIEIEGKFSIIYFIFIKLKTSGLYGADEYRWIPENIYLPT